jgi:hypothetical protein
VEFYYLNEALVKAAEKARIKLDRLQLVFGQPSGAEVHSLVALPPEYAE